MAFLLSGPGMAVCTVGPCGSGGRKGSSVSEACGFNAAATLAAGLAVVVAERALEKASEGRIREGSRAVLCIDEAIVYVDDYLQHIREVGQIVRRCHVHWSKR